ncbi:MAG: hypothetical protein ACI9SP_002622 [Arenicella sp.]
MDINDLVVLKCELTEYGLERGMRGVIVAVFEDPESAYEVEFCNECGESIIEVPLKPEQLEKVNI